MGRVSDISVSQTGELNYKSTLINIIERGESVSLVPTYALFLKSFLGSSLVHASVEKCWHGVYLRKEGKSIMHYECLSQPL